MKKVILAQARVAEDKNNLCGFALERQKRHGLVSVEN